ncbi:MAG: medium chain dehydrogenase/reductase family protein [Sciscionella sp.]
MITTEIVLPAKGGPEVLRTRETDIAGPGPGTVLVRVQATGVAFAEVQMLRGKYPMQPKFPFVPGYDLVGTVTEIGQGVTGIAVGDRVAAMPRTGAWRGCLELPVKGLVAVPAELDAGEALALIMNGVTAWQMLHRIAKVRAGQTVLVHGASGGVGTLLSRLAARAGAHVIGTASAAKHDRLRELGVAPVDYRAADADAQLREFGPYDAVFDHIGGSSLRLGWGLLRRGGTLVSYGAVSQLTTTGGPLMYFAGVLARMVWWNLTGLAAGKRLHSYYVAPGEKFRSDLTHLFELLRSGELHPEIAGRYPLVEAETALRRLVEHRVTGKLILEP